MAMRKSLRFEILRRDNFTCTYCGAKAPDVTLHVDHVVPESLGGSDSPSNLTTACADCNVGKAGRSLDDEVVEAVAVSQAQWKDALKRSKESFDRKEAYIAALDDWFRRDVWPQYLHRKLPANVGATINNYMNDGLVADDIVDLAGVALSANARDKFRYFCGCCRNRIQQIREDAAAIMGGDQ